MATAPRDWTRPQRPTIREQAVTTYTCAECGAIGEPVAYRGPLEGQYAPPRGWESEEYQDVVGWRAGGKLSYSAWFCSRSCRGRWLVRTEALGYLRP